MHQNSALLEVTEALYSSISIAQCMQQCSTCGFRWLCMHRILSIQLQSFASSTKLCPSRITVVQLRIYQCCFVIILNNPFWFCLCFLLVGYQSSGRKIFGGKGCKATKVRDEGIVTQLMYYNQQSRNQNSCIPHRKFDQSKNILLTLKLP